jgi:hypothetical protein
MGKRGLEYGELRLKFCLVESCGLGQVLLFVLGF